MRDDRDMQAHMDWDCVHLNAAKHGLAACVADSPYVGSNHIGQGAKLTIRQRGTRVGLGCDY